jgi:hypothetical protein
MTAVRTDAHFDKMIYPADVAEAAMLVIRTSFNCCPTQIWLQNNPDIIHKVCRTFGYLCCQQQSYIGTLAC